MARGEDDIRAALAYGWLRVWDGVVPELPLPDLDEGETAFIRIALAFQGTAGNPA